MLNSRSGALVISGLVLSVSIGVGFAQGPGRASPPPRDISTGTQPPAPVASGRITGIVLTADTGRPVNRARVFVTAPQLPEGRGVLTDDNGGFTFEELPEGRYSVTVSKSGFITLSYGQRRPLQPGTPLQLGDGQEIKGIEFRLPRGSVIAGHVFDDAGDPLPGANVRLMRYQYAQGERQLVPVDSAQTDDRGSYRMWGLNPGDYYVSAVSRSLNLGGRGAPPPPAGPRGPALRGRPGFFTPRAEDPPSAPEQIGYAPTFYPGVPSINEATPVTIGLGAERVDIDFGLLLVRTSRISGHVTAPDGTATTSGEVNLVPEGSPGRRVGTNYGGRIEWDGVFTINNVPPGRYTLRARAYDTVLPLYAAQPITVANADLAGLAIVLAPGATISGTVSFLSTRSTGVPDLTQVRVTARATDTGGVARNSEARVDKEGRFTLEGVPAGSHWIRAQGSLRGWMLKSVTVDGREMIDTPLDVRSGAAVSAVTLGFTDKLTEVNGTVKDGRGTPFTEYTVVAFPSDASLWVPQARHIITARPDQNGRFQIRGLPEGDYFLTTVDPAEQGEWFDPIFLEQHRAGAARLSLGEGDVKTHDFTLPR